jgi:hypothetical protein
MSDDYGDDYGDLHAEHHDVNALHEDLEQQHEQDQHYAAIAEADHQEHQVHYAHGEEVHAEDGHGGEYDAREFTEYDASSESDHSLEAVEFDSHEADSLHHEITALSEHFDELVAHPEGGELHEIGPAEHYEPEHYEPSDHEPDYAPDVKR